MYGVPAASAATSVFLFVFGTVLAAAVGFRAFRRYRGEERIVVAALVLSLIAVPWIAWRFAEDLSATTRLDAYTRANAGPIQSYLPGYLVDGAVAHVPPGATIAAVAGPRVQWAPARKAFPSLVFETLFPHRTVARPRDADYVITWGVKPQSLAPVSRVWVARPRVGEYLAVYVGKVRR